LIENTPAAPRARAQNFNAMRNLFGGLADPHRRLGREAAVYQALLPNNGFFRAGGRQPRRRLIA